jgi:hypothetical protein
MGMLLAACGGGSDHPEPTPQQTPLVVNACCYYRYPDQRGHEFTDCTSFEGPDVEVADFFDSCVAVGDLCARHSTWCERSSETTDCDFDRCGTLLECTPDGQSCGAAPR